MKSILEQVFPPFVYGNFTKKKKIPGLNIEILLPIIKQLMIINHIMIQLIYFFWFLKQGLFT